MTLEEKIIFYSRDEAVQFQKYLKEKGCPSRISVDYDISGTPYCEGTIISFLSLIDTVNSREEDSELSNIKEDLLSREKALARFIESHKIGDDVTDATPPQILAQLESIHADGNEEIQKQAMDTFVESLMVLATLDDNGLLETSTDETPHYTLIGIKEPGEMRVMYAETDLPGVTTEDCKNTGIRTHIRTSSKTNYIVTTGLEIMYITDMDDLKEFLDQIYVDDEEEERFLESIVFKQSLVEKIQELVQGGLTTEASILATFEEQVFAIPGDDNTEISYDISAEYLSEVLSDLRKEGILKGRDGKIKSC